TRMDLRGRRFRQEAHRHLYGKWPYPCILAEPLHEPSFHAGVQRTHSEEQERSSRPGRGNRGGARSPCQLRPPHDGFDHRVSGEGRAGFALACATSFGRSLPFGATTLLSKNRAARRRHSGRSRAVKITRSGECKNSPKNAFVEDFVIDLLAAESLADRMEAGA